MNLSNIFGGATTSCLSLESARILLAGFPTAQVNLPCLSHDSCIAQRQNEEAELQFSKLTTLFWLLKAI